MKKLFSITILLLALAAFVFIKSRSSQQGLRLYWFIPDGMRADPDLFTVFTWAKEGKLPNIKKLMDRGSYGYSYPNFPSHTPTNFATLLTGSYPEVHGVNDGPMHALGMPLNSVAVGGFRSIAKKVSPIWKTLEEVGMKVSLISIPGSTPPEINKGVVVRGRWGGWGPDFAAINFETKGDLAQRIKQGRGSRLFYFGPQLTEYQDGVLPTGWKNAPKSYSPSMEVSLVSWGATVWAYIYDSTDDNVKNYDRVAFSVDKQVIIADLSQGEWSGWTPVTLKWKSDSQETDVKTSAKMAVIKLGSDGFYRFRIFYDNLNEHVIFPEYAFLPFHNATGPMVDFVDNFPAQLVYYDEDKKIFQDEADMSFAWHKKAVSAIKETFAPNIIIHDIYTPNQMLTSRWWLGSVDPKSARYELVSAGERAKLWDEVQDMYIKLDGIVGEILKVADKNTFIVLSSDHGAVPLDRFVNLNNLFAKKGWLTFTIDPKTGEPIIDWGKTKVIYLKMAHIYINPAGLSGDYDRASGSDYEELRNNVIQELQSLSDEKGIRPVTEIVKWEQAKEFMHLDPDRIGDLVVANAPGYGWNEEMTTDLKIFSVPLISGYKQAINSQEVSGMWTPFIMSGPGIKQNNFIGTVPFSLIDQYPTIMKALGVKSPNFVQGKPLQIFN